MYHFYQFNCYDIRTSFRYSTVLYVVIDFIEEDIRKYYATLFERQNKWSGNNMFTFFFCWYVTVTSFCVSCNLHGGSDFCTVRNVGEVTMRAVCSSISYAVISPDM